MTKAEKLAFHLEEVIWEDQPEGTRMNAKEVMALTAVATDEQKRRAYRRALVKNPLLLNDEMNEEERMNHHLQRDLSPEGESRWVCVTCGTNLVRRAGMTPEDWKKAQDEWLANHTSTPQVVE